jgi:hypothetical protein
MKQLALLLFATLISSCAPGTTRIATPEPPKPTLVARPAPSNQGEVCQRFKGTAAPNGTVYQTTTRSCGGTGKVCSSCQGSANCKSCVRGRVVLQGSPTTNVVLCSSCRGAGGIRNFVSGGYDRCGGCNGSGRVNETQFNSSEAQCIACSATGECKRCQGSGNGTDTCIICQGSGRVVLLGLDSTGTFVLVENPEYKDWVRFKIGSWRKIRTTFTSVSHPENNLENEIEIQTLIEITSEKLVHEIRTGKRIEKETTHPKLRDPEWQILTESDDWIELENKKVQTRCIERVSKRPNSQVWQKVWFYTEAPGGWLRFQQRWTKDGKLEENVEVSVLEWVVSPK